MYIQCKIEARSRNHCCRGKAMSIKYYDCVSVAIAMQRAKLLGRTILLSVCGLSDRTIYFHVIP